MLKINGQPFGAELFANGEGILVDALKPSKAGDIVEVLFQFEGNKDLGDLVLANEYIKDLYPGKRVHLISPFIPYARMDRQIHKDDQPDQLFSLKYFASIINRMNFDKVICYDPHSGVTDNMIMNLQNMYVPVIKPIILKVLDEHEIDLMFAPDKGAYGKYPAYFQHENWFHGEKKRDLNDRGRLIAEETIIHDYGFSLEGKKVIIVDDICVRGGTFVNAAKALRSRGVAEITLFVTHCENAIKDGVLLQDGNELLDRVITTDSILHNFVSPKLMVHNIWKGDNNA